MARDWRRRAKSSFVFVLDEALPALSLALDAIDKRAEGGGRRDSVDVEGSTRRGI